MLKANNLCKGNKSRGFDAATAKLMKPDVQKLHHSIYISIEGSADSENTEEESSADEDEDPIGDEGEDNTSKDGNVDMDWD